MGHKPQAAGGGRNGYMVIGRVVTSPLPSASRLAVVIGIPNSKLETTLELAMQLAICSGDDLVYLIYSPPCPEVLCSGERFFGSALFSVSRP